MHLLKEQKRVHLVVGDLHKFGANDPPSQLLNGRRAIENIKEVELIEDFRWNPLLKKWVLFCSINQEESSMHIKEKMNWYILADEDYPNGNIGFYPAIINGLEKTFQHQNYNGMYEDDRPWRKGKLCLDTGIKALGRYGDDNEPKNSSTRLLWHFQRAILWIKLASRNKLVSQGDPFELPEFSNERLDLVAFSESPVSIQKWSDYSGNYGLVKFVELKNDPHILIAKSFEDTSSREIYSPKWGTAISDATEHSVNGLWVKLNEIPIISPWQVPNTWGELQQILLQQGIDLINILRTNARHFRDGLGHVLMIGFPIPEEFFGNKIVMNWQAINLPVLSHGNKYANGYRRGEEGYWQRDKVTIIRKNDQLNWIDTENWHRNEILNRGKLGARVTQASILQIGAGSLGSMVSEQLVRADQQKLTIVDQDMLQIGNLSRHMMGMHQIRKNKAIELSHKLNIAIPHSKVIALPYEFLNDSNQINYSDYRVIIDCTGEDQVIQKLDHIHWESSKVFISASLGFAAKRLFFFTYKTKNIPARTFFELINPWIEIEREGYIESELPRDGIGCWNPIFPARIDDVWLMSSIVIKNIEKYIQTPSVQPILLVYEQKWEGNIFCGVELVSQEEWNG